MNKRKKAEPAEFSDLGTLDMSSPVCATRDPDQVGVFLDGIDLRVPRFATEQAAAFDIEAYFVPGQYIETYTAKNEKMCRVVKDDDRLILEPGDRALIPTGLLFDIPDGWMLNIYSRSGTSWKQGLILTNSVAVIDSDYVDEVFVSVTNNSLARVTIKSGDRIAQGAFAPTFRLPIEVLSNRPSKKGNRTGGFGSTGQ